LTRLNLKILVEEKKILAYQDRRNIRKAANNVLANLMSSRVKPGLIFERDFFVWPGTLTSSPTDFRRPTTTLLLIEIVCRCCLIWRLTLRTLIKMAV
jgi:hypothetical protein